MKLVWTNGCFDILHRGHFEMFKYAKALGDYLVVGIDSDEKVKKTKAISDHLILQKIENLRYNVYAMLTK